MVRVTLVTLLEKQACAGSTVKIPRASCHHTITDKRRRRDSTKLGLYQLPIPGRKVEKSLSSNHDIQSRSLQRSSEGDVVITLRTRIERKIPPHIIVTIPLAAGSNLHAPGALVM
jgi:hypothetical protein